MRCSCMILTCIHLCLCGCVQYGRCKLGHTIQLKNYDTFTKGDIIQDINYPNVLVYMHPGLPGHVPTMVRFLKPACKEKEAAEHLLHTWLLPWVKFLRTDVPTKDLNPLIHSSLGSIDSAGSMLSAVVGMRQRLMHTTTADDTYVFTHIQITSKMVGMFTKFVIAFSLLLTTWLVRLKMHLQKSQATLRWTSVIFQTL